MEVILNTCPHCSKERVSDGDWESCKACQPILADFPAVEQIENDQARKCVMMAFQAVQKLRCDFLTPSNWVGHHPKDCPQIQDDDTIALPHWMSLRPTAMVKMEDELVGVALKVKMVRSDRYVVLNACAKSYVERFEAFLSNQRTQALNL